MSETATCAKCAYTIKFPFTSGEMVKTFFDSHDCDSTKLQESIRRMRELTQEYWEKDLISLFVYLELMKVLNGKKDEA